MLKNDPKMSNTLERRTHDTRELQKILGLGRIQIQKLVRDGKLPNLGTSRKILVSRAAIAKYLGEA